MTGDPKDRRLAGPASAVLVAVLQSVLSGIENGLHPVDSRAGWGVVCGRLSRAADSWAALRRKSLDHELSVAKAFPVDAFVLFVRPSLQMEIAA